LTSKHTGTDLNNGFVTYTKNRKAKYLVAHSALASDMGVMAQRAEALGIDLIAALQQQNGVLGIIDTMTLIREHKIETLQRTAGQGGSLKQEDLFFC